MIWKLKDFDDLSATESCGILKLEPKFLSLNRIAHILGGKNRIKLSRNDYLSGSDLVFEKILDCYLEDGIKHLEFLHEI